MVAVMREVTWGEALVVAAFRTTGGLAGVVQTIQREVGQHIGSRNTFAKLLRSSGPHELDSRDRFRAWLLLHSFGEDPAEWGISDDVVPPAYDIDRLRRDLRPRLDSNQQPTDTTSPQVKAPKHATILPFYPRPRRVIPATPARRSSPLRRIS